MNSVDSLYPIRRRNRLGQFLYSVERDLVLPVLGHILPRKLIPDNLAWPVIEFIEGTIGIDLDDDRMFGAAAEGNASTLGCLDLNFLPRLGDGIIAFVG